MRLHGRILIRWRMCQMCSLGVSWVEKHWHYVRYSSIWRNVFIPRGKRTMMITSLMQWFRRRQPLLSDAEEIVLAAGGTWFESEFFGGQPNWSRILTTPATKLTKAEQHFLTHEVDD